MCIRDRQCLQLYEDQCLNCLSNFIPTNVDQQGCAPSYCNSTGLILYDEFSKDFCVQECTVHQEVSSYHECQLSYKSTQVYEIIKFLQIYTNNSEIQDVQISQINYYLQNNYTMIIYLSVRSSMNSSEALY
eukprot:TRINITY_DN14517_c0_g1_i1.p1 TRINITY_DN14517_c0_g1~~TRINITY_DN14517_c0_g1_i1.p1  ORF type:complete len:131 (-),score=11.06 TRINITY_DN14517_c0_g1_i1:210-602(-)